MLDLVTMAGDQNVSSPVLQDTVLSGLIPSLVNTMVPQSIGMQMKHLLVKVSLIFGKWTQKCTMTILVNISGSMFIYCTMYNHTLNYFSFDDIMDVFICYIVLCNILICLLYFLLKL